MTLSDLKALFLTLNELEAKQRAVRDQLAAAQAERQEAHKRRYSELGLAEVSRPRASAKGRFTATLDGQKRSQNLRLRLGTLRALRDAANARGRSISELADEILEAALSDIDPSKSAGRSQVASNNLAGTKEVQPLPGSTPSPSHKPRTSKYGF